jgi:hypothetical protein
MSDDVKEHPPLSVWSKVKAGVKGFAKAVMHYLPRGAIFAGALLGVSALMGNAGGWDFLGANSLTSVGQVAGKIGLTMVLGSLVTGSMGAWKSIDAETKRHAAMIAAGGESPKRTQARGQQHEQEIDDESPISGLPVMVKAPEKSPLGATR